jgi:hypothetical protein
MKHGYTLATIYSRTSKRYQVEFWSQPWRHWIVANVYHWYDMHVFKVPGFRRLEKWLHDRHGNDPLEYIPLGCRQDLRCWHLTNKRRVQLVTLGITAEQYGRLGGRYGSEGAQ